MLCFSKTHFEKEGFNVGLLTKSSLEIYFFIFHLHSKLLIHRKRQLHHEFSNGNSLTTEIPAADDKQMNDSQMQMRRKYSTITHLILATI